MTNEERIAELETAVRILYLQLWAHIQIPSMPEWRPFEGFPSRLKPMFPLDRP